jgi:CheY-like chemotaxis protein
LQIIGGGKANTQLHRASAGITIGSFTVSFGPSQAIMSTRILLIDDQLDTVELLAKLLARHGCEVRFTNEPLKAVEIAREFHPDAICVDIGMPDMDGYTLARSLRQSADLQNCKIAAISGYPPDQERMEKAGIDLHLLKPVSAAALIQSLCQPAN